MERECFSKSFAASCECIAALPHNPTTDTSTPPRAVESPPQNADARDAELAEREQRLATREEEAEEKSRKLQAELASRKKELRDEHAHLSSRAQELLACENLPSMPSSPCPNPITQLPRQQAAELSDVLGRLERNRVQTMLLAPTLERSGVHAPSEVDDLRRIAGMREKLALFNSHTPLQNTTSLKPTANGESAGTRGKFQRSFTTPATKVKNGVSVQPESAVTQAGPNYAVERLDNKLDSIAKRVAEIDARLTKSASREAENAGTRRARLRSQSQPKLSTIRAVPNVGKHRAQKAAYQNRHASMSPRNPVKQGQQPSVAMFSFQPNTRKGWKSCELRSHPITRLRLDPEWQSASPCSAEVSEPPRRSPRAIGEFPKQAAQRSVDNDAARQHYLSTASRRSPVRLRSPSQQRGRSVGVISQTATRQPQVGEFTSEQLQQADALTGDQPVDTDLVVQPTRTRLVRRIASDKKLLSPLGSKLDQRSMQVRPFKQVNDQSSSASASAASTNEVLRQTPLLQSTPRSNKQDAEKHRSPQNSPTPRRKQISPNRCKTCYEHEERRQLAQEMAQLQEFDETEAKNATRSINRLDLAASGLRSPLKISIEPDDVDMTSPPRVPIEQKQMLNLDAETETARQKDQQTIHAHSHTGANKQTTSRQQAENVDPHDHTHLLDNSTNMPHKSASSRRFADTHNELAGLREAFHVADLDGRQNIAGQGTLEALASGELSATPAAPSPLRQRQPLSAPATPAAWKRDISEKMYEGIAGAEGRSPTTAQLETWESLEISAQREAADNVRELRKQLATSSSSSQVRAAHRLKALPSPGTAEAANDAESFTTNRSRTAHHSLRDGNLVRQLELLSQGRPAESDTAGFSPGGQKDHCSASPLRLRHMRATAEDGANNAWAERLMRIADSEPLMGDSSMSRSNDGGGVAVPRSKDSATTLKSALAKTRSPLQEAQTTSPTSDFQSKFALARSNWRAALNGGLAAPTNDVLQQFSTKPSSASNENVGRDQRNSCKIPTKNDQARTAPAQTEATQLKPTFSSRPLSPLGRLAAKAREAEEDAANFERTMLKTSEKSDAGGGGGPGAEPAGARSILHNASSSQLLITPLPVGTTAPTAFTPTVAAADPLEAIMLTSSIRKQQLLSAV